MIAQDVVCVRGEDGLLHSSPFSVYFKLPSDQSVLQWLVSRLPAGAAADEKSEGGGCEGLGKAFARTLLSTIGVVPPPQPRAEQDQEEAVVVAAAEAQLAELVEQRGQEQQEQEQQEQEQEQEPEDRPGVDVFVNGTLAPSLEMVVDAKGQCAFAATGTAQPAPSTLADLPLRPGQNAVAFKYGDVIVEASIWLWGVDDTLIVSDVDGTISASDVRGYITTVHLNKYHHTHRGVCRLYSHLAEAHGVRFLYLTSRPLSLLPATRAYIKGARQDGGHQLPAGPIICSPYGLARVLWKELVEKSIRAFKQQALLDAADVFHRAGRPRSRPVFVAGFGNKTQDALAYLGAHVPSDAIFIINPQSEVRLHAHMAAEEEAEAELEAEEGDADAGGGLLQGTYRSRLQKLRGKIPAGWLGGGTSTPPPPTSAQQQEEEQLPDAAFEAAESAPAQPPAGPPVEAVTHMTISRDGSIDGDDELFASASSSMPPTSFPPFSSYSDDRLLRILESVLARDRAPCDEALQPLAPHAAPVGDSNA